ncbi:bestrophin family protein [Roseovarius sp. PS-C2]|uniref:bestrophin family protein n=1 Tax=Roseovarius sp. PS-C2 TaxID=2820814 RepID=UPI001C0BA755|nr:bestrophin family protein [Roseovarius sp. PS-C2]MBU3259358.1 bestrophin family protein [Roseovarius sp. PS-C2]
MILRDKPGIMQLLFALRGSVLPAILPRILGMSLIAAGLVAIDQHVFTLVHTSPAAFAVFGVALSLFLGFRNNAAYERWWEGRRLWGQLVADMRALPRETELFIENPARRERIQRLALAFIHHHRIQLRGLSDHSRVNDWSAETFSDTPHPPCGVLNRMTHELQAARAKGEIDGFGLRALGERMANIALAQAGCERIATTPLPYVYSLLVFRTTYLYCLLLPFALMDTAGWMTPLFVCMVAYVFFGLAEVTEELAHPFGETVNGLPLDAMCRTIEISMAPHLGVEAPPPVKPDNYYLS